MFLRYEMHPVLNRRDKRDIARVIMREKFVAIEISKVILRRQPSARGETAVDVANQTVDAIFELVISWNLYPALGTTIRIRATQPISSG
jgi:hypothetical protein